MDASLVFIIIALVLIFVGKLWMILAGFRISVIWGLVIIFVPLGSLVFLFLYWEDARRPFLCGFFGVLALIPPFVMNWDKLDAKKDQISRVILEMENSHSKTPTESPEAVLAKKQAALLEHASQMNAKYADLIARQKSLPAADDATKAAFAADAEAYAALRKQVATEKAEIEALQAAAPPSK